MAQRRRTQLHQSAPTRRPRQQRSGAQDHAQRRPDSDEEPPDLARRVHVPRPNRAGIQLRVFLTDDHQDVPLQRDPDTAALGPAVGRVVCVFADRRHVIRLDAAPRLLRHRAAGYHRFRAQRFACYS